MADKSSEYELLVEYALVVYVSRNKGKRCICFACKDVKRMFTARAEKGMIRQYCERCSIN